MRYCRTINFGNFVENFRCFDETIENFKESFGNFGSFENYFIFGKNIGNFEESFKILWREANEVLFDLCQPYHPGVHMEWCQLVLGTANTETGGDQG